MEGLLVAMAVYQGPFLERFQVEVELPGGAEFFEEQGVAGHGCGLFPRQQRGDLIAQAEQAAGLQADDRYTALGVGVVGVEEPGRLGAGLLYLAEVRKVRPQQTGRPGSLAARGESTR